MNLVILETNLLLYNNTFTISNEILLQIRASLEKFIWQNLVLQYKPLGHRGCGVFRRTWNIGEMHKSSIHLFPFIVRITFIIMYSGVSFPAQMQKTGIPHQFLNLSPWNITIRKYHHFQFKTYLLGHTYSHKTIILFMFIVCIRL